MKIFHIDLSTEEGIAPALFQRRHLPILELLIPLSSTIKEIFYFQSHGTLEARY